MRKYLVLILAALTLATAVAPAQALSFFKRDKVETLDKVPKSTPESAVYDSHDYLNNDAHQIVKDFNKHWLENDTNHPQLAVVFVDKLGNKSIEESALEIARNWRVGQDDNQGLLLLVAVEDRKWRVEVSDNLTIILPDVKASEIANQMKDDFRNEEYSKGIVRFTVILNDHLLKAYGLKSDDAASFTSVETSKLENDNKDAKIAVIILISVVMVLIVILGDDVSSGSSGWSSSSGGRGGSSGGGFSGGGFGGGGASGGW